MPNLVSLSLFYTSISKTQENYKHSVEKSEQPGEKDWKIGLIVIQCFEKENKDQTKNRGWLQAKGKKGGGKEGLHRLDLSLTDIHSSVLSLMYLNQNPGTGQWNPSPFKPLPWKAYPRMKSTPPQWNSL